MSNVYFDMQGHPRTLEEMRQMYPEWYADHVKLIDKQLRAQMIVQVNGLTYAHVDGPEDAWFWAIVTEYRGAQDYGNVVVAFAEGYEPDHATVRRMMEVM